MTRTDWPLVSLGDVADVIMGQAPKGDTYNNRGEGCPLIAGAGDFGARTPAPKKFTTAPTRLCEPGDVVLSIRASIGQKVLADDVYCLGRGVAGLRARTHLDDRYLWHWLSETSGALAAKGRGATFLQVNRADIAELQVPLPPVEEQRRIAAILDAADEVRASRRESIALIDSFTETIFIDMFGDPVSNPMGWPQGASLGDVAEIVSGITKGRRLNGQPTRTIPYLAVANVQDGHLRMEPIKSIAATDAEIDRYRLVRGDLLLTEGGDPDKLGRGTLWADELQNCIHQNHVFRVRVRDDGFNPEFVSRLVASERGRRYFLRSAKQTTGIASINKTQLAAFPMLRPPLDLQLSFVEQLERSRRVAEDAVKHAEKLDALFASLQNRAFRADL